MFLSERDMEDFKVKPKATGREEDASQLRIEPCRNPVHLHQPCSQSKENNDCHSSIALKYV